MSITIREVSNHKDICSFIGFSNHIHCNDDRWVPPLNAVERKLFNRKKNKAFSYCDVVLALAFESGEVVGRIAGIINHRSNMINKEKVARFGFIECIDKYIVLEAMLEFVELWAINNNMESLIGPMGFNDHDPEGLLVNGFEEETSINSYMNFEYLPKLIEKKGYIKKFDYVVYSIPVPKSIPDFYERIYRRISRNPKFTVLEFTNRFTLKKYIIPILSLMNETFQGLYGFVPLEEIEMKELSKTYFRMIDPRFVKIIIFENKVVAFILGIPNMNEGFRNAKGYLFPFGFIKILRSAKKSKRLDLLLGAIKKEFRGKGLDVLLGRFMLLSAMKAGFTSIDSHHEIESNYQVRMEMEKMGGNIYKRYRVYNKNL